MADWRADVLRAIGAPVTEANLRFLSNWQRWEGGHTNNSATYNWLNTTQGQGTPINSVGVKAFPSYGAGIQNTAATIQNGRYGDIVAGLRGGNPYAADVSAGLSTWVSGSPTGNLGYASKVLGGTVSDAPAAMRDAPAPPTQADPRPTEFPTSSSPGLNPRTLAIFAASQQSDPRSQTLGILGSLLQGSPAPTMARRAGTLRRSPVGARGAASPGPAVSVGPSGGGGIRELFYDPSGAYDEGKWINPIGGHSDHVHASFGTSEAALAAIRQAQAMGLSARENPYTDQVDPVHTTNSYHYRNFPGRYGGRQLGMGLDVSGSSALMAKYFNWIASQYGLGQPG